MTGFLIFTIKINIPPVVDSIFKSIAANFEKLLNFRVEKAWFAQLIKVC